MQHYGLVDYPLKGLVEKNILTNYCNLNHKVCCDKLSTIYLPVFSHIIFLNCVGTSLVSDER